MKMIVCTLIVCATALVFGKFIWPAPRPVDDRFADLNARVVAIRADMEEAKMKEWNDVAAEQQKRIEAERHLLDAIGAQPPAGPRTQAVAR